MSKVNYVGTKEDYWEELIEQWQSGDLSQKAFWYSPHFMPHS